MISGSAVEGVVHLLIDFDFWVQPAWGQHPDPNQWNAAGYYQGYAQGYDQYGYPTQPPQDPAYAQYGNYPGYGNYPQQVC